MMPNRRRGLDRLHLLVCVAALLAGFWIYSEAVLAWLSDVVRLTREVNRAPYLICIALGLVVAGRDGKAWAELDAGRGGLSGWLRALRLATRQIAVVALVVFAMMFAVQDRGTSRLFLGSYLVLAWLGLLALHLLLPSWLARWFLDEEQQVPALVIGSSGSLRQGLSQWEDWARPLQVQVVGALTFQSDKDNRISGVPVLGTSAELARVLTHTPVGQVLLLEMPTEATTLEPIIEACQAGGIRLLIHHDLGQQIAHPLVSLQEGGRLFLTLQDEPLEEPMNRMLKRGFDLAVALPVVVLVLPGLCALVWLAQRFQSPGPLFFRQDRVGQNRRIFGLLKFRTMRFQDASTTEKSQAKAADGRVYALGRFLRRHSLDELPQFWNVLIGDMSVVGPRPLMPWLDEVFERQAKAYRTRQLVKPGITGLAQCEGLRGEVTESAQIQARLRRDLDYIAGWSPALDVVIVARTAWQVFFPPRSAY